MSKFNTIVEGHLDRTSLMKIKVSVDPKEYEGKDFTNSDEYVGYVLKEDSEGNVIAIVPGLGDGTMDLPAGGFEPVMNDGGCDGGCGCQGNPLLDGFKQTVINYLLVKGFEHEITSNMHALANAMTARDVELILKSLSIHNDEIINLYRNYFDESSV